MEKWSKEKRIMDRIDRLCTKLQKMDDDLLELRSQIFGLTDLEQY